MTVEKLHREYGKYLLTCLRVRGLSLDDAQDVRQNIYMYLLITKHEIHDEGIKGFCSSIARNAAISFHEQATTAERNKENCSGGLMVHELEHLCYHDDRILAASRIAAEYHITDGANNVVPILDTLLLVAEGISQEQIAEQYGVDHSTVARWLADWYTFINRRMRTLGY